MPTKQHGGARPATKPDDGRLTNKHGSPGRMPKKFTLKVGDFLWFDKTDSEGNTVIPEELWTVSEITRTGISLNEGSDVTLHIDIAAPTNKWVINEIARRAGQADV